MGEIIKKYHLTDCKQIQQEVFHLLARGIPEQNIYATLVELYYVDMDLLNDALYRDGSLEEMILKIEQEFTTEMPTSPTANGQTTTSQNPNKPFSLSTVPEYFEPQQIPHQPFGLKDPIDPLYNSHSEPIDLYSQNQQYSEILTNGPQVLNSGVPIPEISTPMNQSGQNQDSHFVPISPIGKHFSQDQPECNPTFSQMTPKYSRLTRKPFRYVILTLTIIILVVAGWTAYTVTGNSLENQNQTNQTNQTNQQSTISSNNDEPQDFITVLDPTLTDALITNGNGSAKLQTETSQSAIRILSVRKPDTPKIQAGPMLIEIAPTILKKIAGKKTMINILAKSGDSNPATFTIFCDFGNLGECGRKRFRIGLQPESVSYSILISKGVKKDQKAFLAINTDITSVASLSGKGSQVDLFYVRLKIVN